MDTPSQLWAIKAHDSDTDYLIGNPHARGGVVARVFDNHATALLFAAAPDLKYALEAILRVETGDLSDFRTCEEALAEVRSIAEDALNNLYRPIDRNRVPLRKRAT